MSHFLHVPLTSEAMLEKLDGPRVTRLRCSYSVSEWFRGHIERFCNNSSRAPSDFSSTTEIQMVETREFQIRQKSRSSLKINPKSRSELLYALPHTARGPWMCWVTADPLQLRWRLEYDSKHCEKRIFQVRIRIQNHAYSIFSAKNNTPSGQPTPGGALSPAVG